jgi:hypothetical protein
MMKKYFRTFYFLFRTSRIMDTDSGYLKLDQEFDRYLAEMKPHVLKLPHKTGTNKDYDI